MLVDPVMLYQIAALEAAQDALRIGAEQIETESRRASQEPIAVIRIAPGKDDRLSRHLAASIIARELPCHDGPCVMAVG